MFIFSTSREGITRKVKILENFCANSGMVVNLTKTQFMVLNGDDDDNLNILGDSLVIKLCNKYVYLGAVFTSCGRFVPSLEVHSSDKNCHLLKYVSFAEKNANYPFTVKKQVLDAALLSALTYGCEAWLSENLKPMQPTYMSAVKTLLGVRKTTANDLCLLEIGYPSLKGYVKDKQVKFLKKLIANRTNVHEDPFIYVWNLCRDANTTCARYVNRLLNSNGDLRISDIDMIKQRVQESDRSKFITYKDMNPNLTVSAIYSTRVIEYHRMCFSKFRLSSHNLMIEMGRWSRIPRDQRLCSCSEIQTELHVISACPRTLHIRDSFPHVNCATFANLFDQNPGDICYIISKCLSEFK